MRLTYFTLLSFLFVSCEESIRTDVGAKDVDVVTIEKSVEQKNKINSGKFEKNKVVIMPSGVISIFQDDNNNYWFGTQSSGVTCYNGKALFRFTVKDGLFQNQVQEIHEDDSGNIWFSTGGYGVNRFDWESIITYTINRKNIGSDPETSTWNIKENDLLFYAGGGILRLNSDTLSYLPFPKPENNPKYSVKPPYEGSAYGVYSIYKDRRGIIWIGTQSKGVCRYDPRQTKSVGEEESFTWLTEKGLAGPAVLAIFEDHNGYLWFGNNGRGLFRYDGNTLSNFTEEHSLSNPGFIPTGKAGPGTLARIWAINEDNKGNLWIGTADAGVWRYDGKDLKNFTTKDGLPSDPVETIYKDKKGELWFGTNGSGVYKHNVLSASSNAIAFTKFEVR